MFRIITLVFISLSAVVNAGTAPGVPAVVPAVNPELEAFQDKLDNPAFVRFGVNKRVNMVFGYDYSNWTIIEGDDGLVIVDTGWFIERSKQALADFRKSRSNQKPIVAIIFTHMHSDHIAGIDGLFDGDVSKDVDIYAQSDWPRQIHYDANSGQMLTRRGMSQMGFLLPYKDLAKGSYGAGIGREALRGGALSPTHKPTISIPVSEQSGPVKVTISGVPMEFHYAPSDIDAQLLVWLPEDKTVIVGDAIGGTLPYVITPRHEPERKAESFLYTFRKILALNAEHMIPGHGRPVTGHSEIQSVVTSNYEVISFLHDQVRAYIARGYSADMIIDELELPPRLANNPDLQPHYHTLPWLIRGLYTNEAGWVQEVDTLTQHSAAQQASRWIELLGTDALLDAASKAIAQKDYRWAVSLGSLILRAEPENTNAKKLLIAGLQGVAYNTNSAAERNYALTEAGTVAGLVDWDQIFTAVSARQWAKRDAAAVFNLFGRRFKSAASYGQKYIVEINVAGEDPFIFSVNDGVLLYQPPGYEKIDAKITLSLDSVRDIGSRKLTLTDALDLEQTNIEQGEKTARSFAALIQ